MLITKLLKTVFSELPADWRSWVPADHISRQEWQVRIEHLIKTIHKQPEKLEIDFLSSEVSIYYHKPLDEFAIFTANRLNPK